MEMYLEFIPLILTANNLASKSIMSERLRKFSSRFGKKRDDLSEAHSTVYELPIGKLRDFKLQTEEYFSWMSASTYIPQVMIIGLVSVYDHFLSDLLSTLFRVKREIVLDLKSRSLSLI